MAKRAADRLSRKLDAAAASGQPIDICEEFRVLTLQVISELIVGMGPEEAEQVFPALYLPIVTEVGLEYKCVCVCVYVCGYIYVCVCVCINIYTCVCV